MYKYTYYNPIGHYIHTYTLNHTYTYLYIFIHTYTYLYILIHTYTYLYIKNMYTNYMYNKLIYSIYYSTVTATKFCVLQITKFCEENLKESVSLKNVWQLL